MSLSLSSFLVVLSLLMLGIDNGVNGQGYSTSSNMGADTSVASADHYNVTLVKVSQYWRNEPNLTRYYCTFRNLWTKARHPVDFPSVQARWTPAVIYSSSLQFQPWRVGDGVTAGIEKLVEEGYTDVFETEVANAGEQKLDVASSGGVGFFISQEEFVHIPPIQVSQDYSFLSSAIGMKPSPDWFTGFNSFEVIEEYQRKYFSRFVIQSMPLDAGTDAGTTYSALPADLDPAQPVTQITADTTNTGIFVGPDGKTILPVGEWDCLLHVGTDELERPDCDFLKYPNCNNTDSGMGDCDPDLPSCLPSETSGAFGAVGVMFSSVVVIITITISSFQFLLF